MSDVRLCTCSDRPRSCPDRGALEVSGSRACCFSACAGSTTTQDQMVTCVYRNHPCCLPLYSRESASCSATFRSSIAPPTDTPVYASTSTSRCPPQDSGPGWIRFLLSCRTLSFPTTCRFIPALAALSANRRTASRASTGQNSVTHFARLHPLPFQPPAPPSPPEPPRSPPF
jgi:hypothetical protein